MEEEEGREIGSNSTASFIWTSRPHDLDVTNSGRDLISRPMRTATVFRRVLGSSGPAAPPPPNLAPAFRIQDQHRHSPQFRFPGLPGIWHTPYGEPGPALQAIPPVCALAESPVREVCIRSR